MNFLFTNTPLLFFVQNLWRDEAFSYVMAQKSIIDILRLTAPDFSPPLYYLSLHFWMIIFGTSEIALRSLSLLFFAATVYIMFDILRDVFKVRLYPALAYLFLIIFNPFLLYYAFEARMYMMVAFFVTLSYYALWTNRKWLYIGAITCALYTHYFAVFILFIQFLPYLVKSVWTGLTSIQKRTKLASLKGIFLHPKSNILNLLSHFQYFLTPVLLFAPWALYLRSQHNFSDGSFWIIEPPIIDLFYVPFVLYTGYERVFGEYYHGQAGYTGFHTQMASILWIITGIFIAFFAITLIKKSRMLKNVTRNILNSSFLHINSSHLTDLLLWAFFAPFALFILSYTYQPLYLPRYFIFAVPGFLLLLIVALDTLMTVSSKKKFPLLIGAIILAALLITVTHRFSTLNLKYHTKRNVERMYSEIQTLRRDTDHIYLTSELDFHLAQYYLRTDKNIYVFNKTYEEIPQYVGKVLIPPSSFAQMIPTFPVKAFIVYYNWFEIRSTL